MATIIRWIDMNFGAARLPQAESRGRVSRETSPRCCASGRRDVTHQRRLRRSRPDTATPRRRSHDFTPLFSTPTRVTGRRGGRGRASKRAGGDGPTGRPRGRGAEAMTARAAALHRLGPVDRTSRSVPRETPAADPRQCLIPRGLTHVTGSPGRWSSVMRCRGSRSGHTTRPSTQLPTRADIPGPGDEEHRSPSAIEVPREPACREHDQTQTFTARQGPYPPLACSRAPGSPEHRHPPHHTHPERHEEIIRPSSRLCRRHAPRALTVPHHRSVGRAHITSHRA